VHHQLREAYAGQLLELCRELLICECGRQSFGAITDVHQEGPSGSFRAFADDPKGHARLVEETYKVGLAKGEPAVLAGDAVEHKSKGNLLSFVGATDAARAEYLRALAYDVASVAGLAEQNGVAFAGRDDPKGGQA
jgi:hypothetical protein